MVAKIKKSILAFCLMFSVLIMFGFVAANPLAVQGTSPVDYFNSTSSSLTFDMKCSDDIAVNTIQLWTGIAGIWQVNYSNDSYVNDTWLNITLNEIQNGANHVWAVYCNDTFGNISITQNRTFSVDSTNPVAVLGGSPADNANATDGSVTFDMKCYDNVAVSMIQLWTNTTGTWHANYSNDAYTNNTWLNITVTGIPNGQNYKWAVWCNDTSNLNNISASRTLNVSDAIPPVIILPFYTNLTAKKNTDTLTLSIMVTDSNIPQSPCWIDINGTNQTINYSDGWCNGTVALTGLSNGNKTIKVYENDSLGNMGLNNSYFVLIDTTVPVVTLHTPENGDEVSTVRPTLEYDVIDNSNLDVCYLYINNVQKMEDDDLINGSNSFTVSYSLGDGVTYDWYVKCYDRAGNLGTSEEWSFTVNTDSGGGGGGSSSDDTGDIVIATVASAKVAGDVLTGDKTITGLVRGDRVNFSIGNATHDLIIINVTANYTTFEIRSILITAIINSGETKSFDLDGNGKNDFAITVQGISALRKVNIILKSVKESESNSALTGNIVNDTNSSSNKSAGLNLGFISDIKWDSIGGFFVKSWIYLLVFVVVAGGVIVLIVFRDKVFKSNSRYWWRKGSKVRLK